MIKRTEREIGRSLGPGDVVLYWSGYVDRTTSPARPGGACTSRRSRRRRPPSRPPTSTPRTTSAARGSARSRLDSPSIGAFWPAGLRHARARQHHQTPKAHRKPPRPVQARRHRRGGLINFDKVPNGSLFITLPVKHVRSPTAETRAVAITDPQLSRELLAAVRAQQGRRPHRALGDGQPRRLAGRRDRQLRLPLHDRREPRVLHRPDRALLGEHAHHGLPDGHAPDPAGPLRPAAGLRPLPLRRADRRLAPGIRGAARARSGPPR